MNESQNPSPAEVTGRKSDGKFAKGNKIGKGNPSARRAQRLRIALLSAVRPGDIRDVVASLITKAKSGDVPSAKLLLDRCLGKTTLPESQETPKPESEDSEDDTDPERSPLLDDQQVSDDYFRLVVEFEQSLLAAKQRILQQQYLDEGIEQ